MEAAYQRLMALEELSRSEIRELFSEFNPAYVAAILAALPGVTYSRKPIALKWAG